MPVKPPVDIELEWQDDFRFRAEKGEVEAAIDGQGRTALSPVTLLLASLASCTGADVVDILRKGRQELRELRIAAHGERRQEPPHRYVRVRLVFRIGGHVERAKAERAVELSLEKYCSVLHTLAEDLEVDWEVDLTGT